MSHSRKQRGNGAGFVVETEHIMVLPAPASNRSAACPREALRCPGNEGRGHLQLARARTVSTPHGMPGELRG
jgi:hypothetical protein